MLEARNTLRKSEVKVADYVLQHAESVIHMRIVDLAQEAQVSEPTIVRFCRALGLNGFQAFKVRLAQAFATQRNLGQFAVTDDDTCADIIHKIFDTSLSKLMSVRDHLDPLQVRRAIDALSRARRVEFYGFGASGAVAVDAMHKFFRLQFATAAYSDPHMQSMSAATLSKGDVVVAISQSGRTKDLIHAMAMAKKAQANVIALCPPDTPVSEQADLPIDVRLVEDTDIFTPMTSRIAHLMVIDALAVGVAQKKGPEFDEHLKRIKESLSGLRTEIPQP
ncbi:MAG: SIS domain-containing protein [Oceanospirillaceae bacterium]|nr:SIS domain-containing protein [Oceanospirillaceae bacterium]MCP5334689.1 SIS domain-containing protein [Oceanospirillaceae bacterium]MCP5351318.1 SIS domain-containing protein [Oceanospirillaceae bacterium]